MPLTGSDFAYKQARSGIARSGATRSGYFTPNVVITINSVNRTSSVLVSSLHISMALNDEPDTASFTLKPGATIPTVGQTISIALGSSSNAIFGGQIARVTHRRVPKTGGFNVFVDVDCIDWTQLFDRTIVNATYTSESATDIIADLVADASGFTDVNVEAGLPTIDFVSFTNERRSRALRRVIGLMGGGGFYIAPDKDIHAFGVGGETGIGAPSNPLTLTNTSAGLMSFSHSYDYSQVRNRIIVEGQYLVAAVDRPSDVFSANGSAAASLIVESGVPDFPSVGSIRFGTQRATYEFYRPFLQTDAGVILGGESVTTASSAMGATTITVADTTDFENTGTNPLGRHWARVDGQYITYASVSTSSGAGNIQGIPASGFGSIQVPIASGTAVYTASYILGVSDGFERDVKKGDLIYMLVQDDDATSQTAIAAIEGGDGVHEHVIQDGRLSYDGAVARAATELDAFKDPITSVDYDTDDMNALPGAQQVINLTTTDAFSDTLTITKVNLSFPIPNYRPTRRCQASTVKLAQFADLAQAEAT